MVFICYRILIVSLGLTTTMVPIWVAETSKATSRGALIATQLTIVILGLTIAYWVRKDPTDSASVRTNSS